MFTATGRPAAAASSIVVIRVGTGTLAPVFSRIEDGHVRCVGVLRRNLPRLVLSFPAGSAVLARDPASGLGNVMAYRHIAMALTALASAESGQGRGHD